MYLPIISEMRRPSTTRLPQGRLRGRLSRRCPVPVTVRSYLPVLRPVARHASFRIRRAAVQEIKKISYGVALPGLVIGMGIYNHVAAKYLFVRVLRNSRHLQQNTMVHWATWLGVNVLLGTLAFVVAEAVPILNYLHGLAAALCFAPFSLVFPAVLWMYDFGHYRSGSATKEMAYGAHVLIALIGGFMVVGGT